MSKIDITKPFRFISTLNDDQEYDWDPVTKLVKWLDPHGALQTSSLYSASIVARYINEGTWKVVEDSAWYKDGKFPPAGSTVRLNPGYVCYVVGLSETGSACVVEYNNGIQMVKDPKHFKPRQQTAEEKHAKAVAADLGITEDLAYSIIAKGYTKQ